MFYGTVVPLIIYVIIKKGFVDPLLKEQKTAKIERQKQANYTKLQEKKKEAQAAQELMLATFNRSREEESNRKGLVIVKALYGPVSSG